MSGDNTKMVTFDPESVTPEQRAEQVARLTRLAEMRDEDIDLSDMPEITAEQWAQRVRGSDFRPNKRPVTMRLDADIVRWFKEQAGDRPYQTEINRVLRQHVTQAQRRAG